MSLESVIWSLVASDEQLELLSEITKKSDGEFCSQLDQLEFLKLIPHCKSEIKSDVPVGEEKPVKLLQEELTEILSAAKSIRSRKENIAMIESKKQVIKTMCLKETTSLLNLDTTGDESPQLFSDTLETTENRMIEKKKEIKELTSNLEKYVDEAQMRLSARSSDASVRIVNANNRESEFQGVLSDFIFGEKNWISEDTMELRYGSTKLKLKLKLQMGASSVEIVDCETFGIPNDLDNLKEMNLRWNSIFKLMMELSLRHQQEKEIQAVFEDLRTRYPLDWKREENSLELLARNSHGQSAICVLKPITAKRLEVTSICGLDIDSSTACSAFPKCDIASLRSLIDELIQYCGAH